MKKFLSLVLALVMTMSLVTVSAGAKDFTDDKSIVYDEAVDVMSAVKVLDGYTDGSFNPQATLTRGAAAKIICNLILGPTTAAALSADTAPYKDVPTNHTFAGYIAYCQQQRIISGYADGTFRPAASLTGYAFMKMLLGALGYDQEIEGYVGANWSIAVAKRALNIGLDDGLTGNFVGTKPVTREEAALYALNTLKADMVEYEAKTSVSVGDANVVIAGSKAQTVANPKASDNTIHADGVMQFAEKYFSDLQLKFARDDFDRPANQWKVKTTEIGKYTVTPDLTYSKGVNNGDIYKDLGLGEKMPASDVTVYIDGVETANKLALAKGEDSTIGEAGNGVLTEVYLREIDKKDVVEVVQVHTYVGEVLKTVAATDKKDAYVVISTNSVKPTGTAGTVEFTTDEKFDDDAIVLYTYSVDEKAVESLAVAEIIEGTVTEAQNKKVNGADAPQITIAEKDYKASAKFTGKPVSDVSVKNDYTVYLDSYGYMIRLDEVENLSSEYAMVLDTAAKGAFVGNKADLLFADGTTKVVTTDKNYCDGKADDQIADNTIVTFKVDEDGVYTLREVQYNGNDASKKNNTETKSITDKTGDPYNDTFEMHNDNAVITVKSGTQVKANSKTVFVVANAAKDSYDVFTGIKNAPTIEAVPGRGVAAYWYAKNSSNMVNIMFIFPEHDSIVKNANTELMFLAGASVSNLKHNSTGDYFEYNAVVNDEITTVKVDMGVKNAGSLNGMFDNYNTNKKGVVTALSLSALTAYTDSTYDGGLHKLSATGLEKTNEEYTLILNNTNGGSSDVTVTVDENADIFYVDKDGKITEMSYKGIAADTNDEVLAMVKDHMIQDLFICEVPDDAAAPSVVIPGAPAPVGPKASGKLSTSELNTIIAKNGGVIVEGDHKMDGTLKLNDGDVVTFLGKLDAKANTEVIAATSDSSLVVGGDLVLDGTQATIDNKVWVAGDMKLYGDIEFKNNVAVSKTIDGDSTGSDAANSKLTIAAKTTAYAGDIDLGNKNLDVYGTLHVVKDTDIGATGTIDVGVGKVNVYSSNSLHVDVKIIADEVKLGANAQAGKVVVPVITGKLTLGKGSDATVKTSVSGAVTVTDAALEIGTASSTLTVSGASKVEADTVTGKTTVTGGQVKVENAAEVEVNGAKAEVALTNTTGTVTLKESKSVTIDKMASGSNLVVKNKAQGVVIVDSTGVKNDIEAGSNVNGNAYTEGQNDNV